MSHFPTSQPSTAFYPKLGCIQFPLQKLEMLTPVPNDTDDANDEDNAEDYNRVIGIALLFSCDNKLLCLQIGLHSSINVSLTLWKTLISVLISSIQHDVILWR